jgi:hypothetical protein
VFKKPSAVQAVTKRGIESRDGELFIAKRSRPHNTRTETVDKPTTDLKLRQIGVILERIASHGVRRHPRTPVWSVLAEMARDIVVCSEDRIRKYWASGKQSKRRYVVVKNRKVAA